MASSLKWVPTCNPITFPFYCLQLDTLSLLLGNVFNTYFTTLPSTPCFFCSFVFPTLSSTSLSFFPTIYILLFIQKYHSIKQNIDLTPSLVFLNLMMSYPLSLIIAFMLASSTHQCL